MHWNINQKDKDSNTPGMVASEILKETSERKRPDIIVLTEFLKTRNYENVLVKPLEDNGYTVFLDPRNAKKNIRQVLIAILKDAMDTAQPVDTTPIYLPDNEGHLFEDNESNAYPNFLRVDFFRDFVPMSVIGTRIRICINKIADEQALSAEERQARREREHRFRQRQLECLLREIPSDRKIIMLGDLNIDESFVDNKKKNWDYNRHYLPSLDSVELHDCPPENMACLLSGQKLDHLLLSNDLAAINIQYDDKWEQRKAKNYPDHPILTATVVDRETWICTVCGRRFPMDEFSIPDKCDDCKQGEE